MVLLGTESQINAGPMAGKTGQNKVSDYDEVDGLYFPFSMSQGVKDGPSETVVIDKIQLNSTVDHAAMQFPDEAAPATQPTTKPSTQPTSRPTTAPTSQPGGNNK